MSREDFFVETSIDNINFYGEYVFASWSKISDLEPDVVIRKRGVVVLLKDSLGNDITGKIQEEICRQLEGGFFEPTPENENGKKCRCKKDTSTEGKPSNVVRLDRRSESSTGGEGISSEGGSCDERKEPIPESNPSKEVVDLPKPQCTEHGCDKKSAKKPRLRVHKTLKNVPPVIAVGLLNSTFKNQVKNETPGFKIKEVKISDDLRGLDFELRVNKATEDELVPWMEGIEAGFHKLSLQQVRFATKISLEEIEKIVTLERMTEYKQYLGLLPKEVQEEPAPQVQVAPKEKIEPEFIEAEYIDEDVPQVVREGVDQTSDYEEPTIDLDAVDNPPASEDVYVRGNDSMRNDCISLCLEYSKLKKEDLSHNPQVMRAATTCTAIMLEQNMVFYRNGEIAEEIRTLFKETIDKFLAS